MNSSQLFGITTLLYLLASVAYIAFFIFRSRPAAQVGLGLTILGILVQTAGLGLRWHESYQLGMGHAPLTNMYESLLFFAWCAAIFYVLLEIKFKLPVIGAFVMPIPFLTLAYTSIAKDISKEISPLIPALQSNWLIAHVITCFIGYGAFAVAAGLGIMYLLKHFADKIKLSQESMISSLPDLRTLDDLIHKTIIFGFLWLSAGIITGAVWANEAWGTYWQWDARKHGRSSPGLSMPSPSMPASHAAGTAAASLGSPCSALFRFSSPILESTICWPGCTATARADKKS